MPFRTRNASRGGHDSRFAGSHQNSSLSPPGFGAGFTTALVLLSFRVSLIRIGIVAEAVYAATFTAASRGGHKA